MNDTKSGIDVARASVVAIFDDRLAQLADTTGLLSSVDETLRRVDQQLRSKPLQVKEQVQKELAEVDVATVTGKKGARRFSKMLPR